MFGWRPDWKAMVAQAAEIDLEGQPGAAYVVADTHLGDARATPEAFLNMLAALPDPGVVIFLGDLFKVWLALPRFANDTVRAVLAGMTRLRARGARLVFVVGNREYLVPADAVAARALGLRR